MIRLAFGFLLSLMFSNWVLSEFRYFAPSMGSSIQKTFNTLSFPTHDRWGEIVTASNAEELQDSLESGYERFTFHKTMKGMFSYLNPSRYFSRGQGEEVDSEYADGGFFQPLFSSISDGDGRIFTSLFTELNEQDQLVRF